MLEEKTKQKIPEIVDSVHGLLVKLKYGKDTIRKFKTVWDKFLEYSKLKQHEFYSVELSQFFLREIYSIEIGTKLAPKNYGKARAIQLLTNYYLNQAINLRRKHTSYIPPESFKTEIDGFMQGNEKNQISESTKKHILYDIYNFIAFLSQKDITTLSDLSPQDIHSYIQTLSDYSKATIRHITQNLRKFLSYLYTSGFHNQNLSLSIPHIKSNIVNTSIPSVYTEEEIARLLKSVDRANPIGKRDYAILLLATKLGLRTGEVRNLKLKSLKWETNRIELIQEKTGQVLNLPILEDVGFAIIDYLKNGRPSITSELVFLKHVPPFDKLSAVGIYDIVIKYFRQSGIPITQGRKHGLHSLRHSLASHLLEKQTPIVVISEILGHLNSSTTSVYLKVDIKQLRTCSLEVPNAIN